MKNKVAVFVVLLFVIVLCVGCTGDYTQKVVSVSCDYGNIKEGEAMLLFSVPVDFGQCELKSKSDASAIYNLIGGDVLEIVCKQDGSIKEILVDTAMTIKLDKSFNPGDNSRLDFFVYIDSDVDDQSMTPVIKYSHLNYIIDKDGCLVDINEGYKYEQLYGVYTKENVEKSELYTRITLTAIYACDPRSVALDYVIIDDRL